MTIYPYIHSLALQSSKICKEYGIVYLAIQMRVGKTLISLFCAEKLKAKKVLFITYKSIIPAIKEDYKKVKDKVSYILDIVNYESVHKLPSTSYDVVIIDEAQTLGAFPKPTKRTKLIKGIVSNSKLILMSGTPSPETSSQLYHQFWVSNFSPFREWKNFYSWAKSGFVMIGKKYFKGLICNDYSIANGAKIKTYTNKYFVSYTQKEAKFKVYEIKDVVHCIPVLDATKGIVNSLIKDRLYKFTDGSFIICETSVKLQNKIHQLYSGTVIAEKDNYKIYKYIDASKIAYILNNYQGKKIAIYYLYQAEKLFIKDSMYKFSFTTDFKDFNKSENKVFISQFKSGSKGINLSTADVIIMYNISFSSEIYWQVRQRAQMRDKNSPTEIHWLFSEGGIEEKIYQRVLKKRSYTLQYFKKDYIT